MDNEKIDIEQLLLDENKKTETKEHHINQLNKEAKNNMFARTIMAIIILLVTVPCLFGGGVFWLLFIFFLSIIITHEIVKAPQSIEKRFKPSVYVFAYFMVISLTFGIFLRDIFFYIDQNGFSELINYDIKNAFIEPSISLALFFISIVFFFIQVFIDKNFTIFDAFYFIGIIFIASLGLQCLIYLRFIPFRLDQSALGMFTETEFKYFISPLLVLYFFMATCLNDVGAYLFGVLFGKKKMCPNISPKKTWGGFFGGWIFSFIISSTFALLLVFYDINLVDGILDKEHWYIILIISFLIPLSATFGDLLFSSIKRGYKIKDFGTILKSHGGILDRFDSIIVTSIIVSVILMFLEKVLL